MTGVAPIAVFAYRRSDHLRRTLESLQRCAGFSECPLYVFGDGAKGDADAADVAAVRSVARSLLGDRAEYRWSPENRGLSASVIAGVSAVLEKHDRIIVVEDDMELSPGFLEYMTAALRRYAGEPRVMQVSGHMFDVPEFAGRDVAVMLPFTTSWGWATWRRAWAQFDPDAHDWQVLASDRSLRRRFNVGGVYDFATMLERQMSGIGDSWAVRWNWSVFRADGLVVFPPAAMVRNTGMDGSGTHGRGRIRRFRPAMSTLHPGPVRLPDRIEVDGDDFSAVRRALWRQNGGMLGAIVDRVRRLRMRRMRPAGAGR
jgi:GNT-I family